MKRFWFILLTLGLLAVFSTQALAVDVKVSGSFYVAGVYQDKTTLMKNTTGEGPSTAFYYQRLRVQTDFTVAKGLKLVTRFDALERSWGAARSTTQTAADSAGTRAENENIAIDLAYIDYTSPIGQFKIGMVEKGRFGTEFANSSAPVGLIYWGHYFPKAFLYVWAEVAKQRENSYSAVNATTYTDLDNDEYLAGIHFYGIKGAEFGLMYDYGRYAAGRSTTYYGYDFGYVSAAHLFEAYTKAKIGPVRIEAEVDYTFGDWTRYDVSWPGYPDVKITQLQAYAKAVADIGPAYVGGIFAYVSGDDPGTTDKVESGWTTGGRDFQPCLILFNWERTYWAGNIAGYDSSVVSGPMTNAWFGQVLAGVKPVSALNIMASVSYATADKKPSAAWLYNEYGYELDLTATYKITNNLTYMLGGGYLFAGKYFKGTSDSNELSDNFLVLNKLTLTF